MRRRILFLLMGLSCLVGCHAAYRRSVGANQDQVFSRIFLTDSNTAWMASVEALKSFRMDISNQKLGFIQTRWTDNTIDKNSTELLGGGGPYLKAQYRFRVNLSPGYIEGRGQGIKISVLREQWVQRDVLEGWRPAETDSIEENTLLYRIGRIIAIRTEVDRLERAQTEKELSTEPDF